MANKVTPKCKLDGDYIVQPKYMRLFSAAVSHMCCLTVSITKFWLLTVSQLQYAEESCKCLPVTALSALPNVF